VFARVVLRVGASGLGFLSASVGAGAVVAALGLAASGARVGKGRILVWTGPIYGAALIAFGAARAMALALPVLAVAGGAMILNNAVTNTLLQTIVPDALRGRVMGFYAFVFLGMAPFGAFQAGWLAEQIGAPATVAIGGTVCAIVSLVIWRKVPEVPALQ